MKPSSQSQREFILHSPLPGQRGGEGVWSTKRCEVEIVVCVYGQKDKIVGVVKVKRCGRNHGGVVKL